MNQYWLTFWPILYI